MYYRIKDGYALRGWKGLPYAIGRYKLREATDDRQLTYSVEDKPYFFTKEQFDVVRRFDGRTFIDETAFSNAEEFVLKKAVEIGLVEISDKPLPPLSVFQKYVFYPALYVRDVVWSITGRCNLRCRHCILENPHNDHDELSIEECRLITDQLAECGIQTVTLTGGEPLVRNDFLQIVQMLTERNIEIKMIMTNGYFVTSQLLDALESFGQFPDFQISFDGLGFHDSMRNMPGAQEKALDAMRLLVQRGYTVTSSMCIDKDSALGIRDTVNLLAEIGVDSLGVLPPQRLGAWTKSERALTYEESLAIYLDYLPRFFEDKMPISINLGGVFSCGRGSTSYKIPCVRSFSSDEKLQKHLICKTARYTAYISAKGQLMPCLGYSTTDYEAEFVSVLDIPLKDALSSSLAHDIMMCRMKEYFDRNEKCRSCEKRLECAGGCRVNAMAGGGDNMSIDEDVCAFHLGGYESRIREVADNAIRSFRLG